MLHRLIFGKQHRVAAGLAHGAGLQYFTFWTQTG
jgi:hypothetical protein